MPIVAQENIQEYFRKHNSKVQLPEIYQRK